VSAQPVVASVHIADVGPGRALALLRKAPAPGSIHGLRHANVGVCVPLSGAGRPIPSPGRVVLVGWWDDDDAVGRFESGHPLAAALSGGWHARLAPVRAHGTWPGLPSGIDTQRDAALDGPAIVLTLGRLRLTQTRRFLKASRPAERAASAAPGLLWGTAAARPPFVATCSLWASSAALSDYAYGRGDPAHPDAIAEQNEKDFHHVSAFVRFRPYDVGGSLAGRNPLPRETVAQLA
jgi:hypothetical protein